MQPISSRIMHDMRTASHTAHILYCPCERVLLETQYGYCLFQVNLASRLESTGVPGCIHVSEETFNLTSRLPDFKFTERGEINVSRASPPTFSKLTCEWCDHYNECHI